MKMGPLIRVALGLTILGAVTAAEARGQYESGAGLPGIASFDSAASRSSVSLVAVLSFASLVMGLAAMFTRRLGTTQLTPPDPESGLHRAQRRDGRVRGAALSADVEYALRSPLHD